MNRPTVGGRRPGRVVVLGSLNADQTAWVDALPGPGETVLAEDFFTTLGGKGFNQAVTAARMGAAVTMVGCVGDDRDGAQLVQALRDEGVDVANVRRHYERPTGRAQITVNAAGENTIVVVPGANQAAEFPSAVLDGADVLLAQLECPPEVVVAALAVAHAGGVTTVLNPSPAFPLSVEALGLVDYLVPNRVEASVLPISEWLAGRGGIGDGAAAPGTVIVTLGAKGALVHKGGRERRLPAVPVAEVVDPTAAGDAFCGALAAGVALGWSFAEVLSRAAAAGAHAVTVAGALPSLPTLAQVDALRQANVGGAG